MTEEEKKEAQRLADLRNATELFGLDKSLDELKISSKEDYLNYINVFYAKVNVFSVSVNLRVSVYFWPKIDENLTTIFLV